MQSIVNNKNELNIMVQNINLHITGITESWAKKDISPCTSKLCGGFIGVPERMKTTQITKRYFTFISYGIQGKVLEWIADFLSDKKMLIMVRSEYSEWFDIISGVPQGETVNSNVNFFADDTKKYSEH